jgi:RecG-like helicase
LPSSFGFRPKIKVNSVIYIIKNKWYSNWFAFCDISKLFNNIKKNIFIKKLKEYIFDENVIKHINEILNMQVVGFKPDTKNRIVGISQDCILSPLLFNLYVYSLNEFIEKIIKSITKTDRRKSNLEYRKMTESESNKIKKLLAKVKYKITKKQRKSIKELIPKKLINDPEKMPVRMYYARYADDFILGFFMFKI